MGLKVILGDGAHGDSYPPSMKAIMGITTSPSRLSSCHCHSSQYLMPTLGGIL